VRARLLLAAACCAVSSLALPLGAQSAPAGGYHVLRRIPVGGEGGWDYLTFDTAGKRLFLSRGTHVMVLDVATDKVVGDIPNTGGVHGIALAYDLHKGYTSNGRDTTVTVFDPTTLAVQKVVHVTGANPDAILYDPATKRVFTFNGRGQSTTAIDATTDAVAGTLALGGKPETAVADGTGRVFVNIEDKSQIVEFDGRTMTLLHTYPLTGCDSPSGLAIDLAHHLLFAGCDNAKMAVVDATNGHVITTVPTGQGTDANAFDPATGLAFSSNGESGTLTVVHETGANTFVGESVATARGARTMALDPVTHRVYTVTAQFNPAPAPAAGQPRQRPSMVPNSFVVIVLGQ
jgi:DNA-binding beta-propeller fold protein YncE